MLYYILLRRERKLGGSFASVVLYVYAFMVQSEWLLLLDSLIRLSVFQI